MDEKIIVLGENAPEKQQEARRMRAQMTFAERALWQQLRANRLDNLHFRRQQVVFGFIADFYCHAQRLIVEVDGAVHVAQGEYDSERDRILTQNELRVLRFTNTQVLTQMPAVKAAIRAAVRQETLP